MALPEEWRHGWVEADDGARLHFGIRGHGDRHVLLLHWLGGCIANWDAITRTTATSCRWIALEFRGHGESESPTTSFDNTRLVRDVLLLADALGCERFSLVGHSYGGKIALLVAAAAPERVQKVVLLGAVGPPKVALDPAVVATVIDGASDIEFLRTALRSWFTVWNGESLEAALVQVSATPRWALQSIVRNALETDVSAEVGRISTPALILAGEHDPVYGPDYQRSDVLPFLLRPTLTTFPCGHGLALECPQEVARAVGEFLNSTKPAPESHG